jgi:hypothetical protein
MTCRFGIDVRVGERDDAGDDEDRRVSMVIELVPILGEEIDGGEEERDWFRVGVEKRLVAVGASSVTVDGSAGAVAASLGDRERAFYDLPDYRFADNSVVHWRQFHRLHHLLDSCKGRAVVDGADALARCELDPWQKFARDIVARRDREWMEAPIRCFMIGTAGTGKSRPVRSFVRVKRSSVKRKLEDKYESLALQTLKVLGRIAEAVRRCCQLGLPVGCASFQLKSGASNLHRLFGVPVGYCGLAVDRTSNKYEIKRERVFLDKSYVLEDTSMIACRMLGKIEFKLRDHFGNVSSLDGSDPVVGQKDYIMCGDPKAGFPIGEEFIHHDGEYIGKAVNKLFEALDVPSRALSAKKLVQIGFAIREACEDVVIPARFTGYVLVLARASNLRHVLGMLRRQHSSCGALVVWLIALGHYHGGIGLRVGTGVFCIDKPIVVLCPHREWCTMDFEQVRVA